MRMGKVLIGVRATLNAALVMGDGIGKPLGILHPSAGIQICETSASTPPGQVSAGRTYS
jgi:hypothetical protein